jgi:hypothetical protein
VDEFDRGEALEELRDRKRAELEALAELDPEGLFALSRSGGLEDAIEVEIDLQMEEYEEELEDYDDETLADMTGAGVEE